MVDYNKAIEIDSNYAKAYNNRGNLKKDLKDYTGAISDYNKAIELNPKGKDAYRGRGIVKYHLGQKESGCLDFSKAGELGDKDAYSLIKQFCQ